MYKGKTIIGKSIDSQGKEYFYFDGKDIGIKTFGNDINEALQIARIHFNYLIEDTINNYNEDTKSIVKPAKS